MGAVALELDHVSAFVADNVHVDDLSLTVQQGETVALVGSNDSGKGLALRLCAGFETPAAGSVRVLGVDPAQATDEEFLHLRLRVGFVFDKPALVSNMNVFNNVALPLRYHTALSEAEIQDRVMARLAECGVDALRDRFPAELAVGEARLVALARARVTDTAILLIDELLFGLDAGDLVRLRGLFEGAWKDAGLTVIATINAPTNLVETMDRLVLLRDGRLVAACSPIEAFQVDDPMVLEFFGA
jgi:phospholipid/cholesterol/gamma-HCH transport system ATP-binding protein